MVTKKKKRPGRPKTIRAGSKSILDYFAWWWRKNNPNTEAGGFYYCSGDVTVPGWSFEELGIPVTNPSQYSAMLDKGTDDYLLIQGDKGVSFIPWPTEPLTREQVLEYDNWQKNAGGHIVGKELHAQTMEED